MQSPSGEHEALLERLAKLERQCRRIRRLGGGLLALALLLSLQRFSTCLRLPGHELRAQENRVVEAEEFVLRDSRGAKRASLSMTRGEGEPEQPFPSLALHDSKGRKRLTMDARSSEWEGPAVRLYDSASRCRASLRMVGDDGSVLSFADQGGRRLARLQETCGVPVLAVGLTEHGATVMATKNGASLTLRDYSGGSVSLDSGMTNGPSVNLDSWQNGKTVIPRAFLGVGDSRSGVLRLNDATGNPRAVVGSLATVTREGPRKGTSHVAPPSSIHLFDENGELLWQAP